MIVYSGEGYERVVLSPTRNLLNLVATWSPIINCTPQGEWWGFDPYRVLLRYQGHEIDLFSRMSKYGRTSDGLSFVFDTGTSLVESDKLLKHGFLNFTNDRIH